MTPSDWLARAEEYLQTEVKPRANEIDADPAALGAALEGLFDRGLMALRRPEAYGGPAMPEREFRLFQESVARASGALAFLQTQHQSAASLIAKGTNEDLRETKLRGMATGETRMGIGFSQLRREWPPVLRAEPVSEGYRLTGTVPWITGFSFFHEYVVGASLLDGRAVFGVLPLADAPGCRMSPPMRLAALESPQTVAAEIEGQILPLELVVNIQPEGWIRNNDMINITLQASFALGCARAGIDIVEAAAERRGSAKIGEAAVALLAELAECREALQASEGDDAARLAARAWAIDLAVRCAHAGVTVSGGAANSIRHDAQRVYREALVFTVSAQTVPIMEATLDRLVRARD